MPLWPAFVGGTAGSESPLVTSERTMNLYPERVDAPGAPYPWVLYPIPGMQHYDQTFYNRRGRGMFAVGDRLFWVSSSYLSELGVYTSRGTVANTDDSPVAITFNGDAGQQLFLAASGTNYVFDLTTNVLTALTGFTEPITHCGMLDGFIWALDPTSSSLWVSAPFDATTFPALQMRDLAPDPWRAGLTVGRQLLLCGAATSELWYNAGTYPFPFAPNPSGAFGIGIAAPRSLTGLGDGAIWVARSKDGQGDVVVLEGSTPRSVASQAVRNALAGYSRIDDAIGTVYEDRGHVFYVLTFPTANATWCYDASTTLWHERGSWDATANRFEQWGCTWHVFVRGSHVWLSLRDGLLYETSSEYVDYDIAGPRTQDSSDNFRPIRRVRQSPPLWQDGARFFVSAFTLLVETGLGKTPTVEDPDVIENYQGGTFNPKVLLEYSDDGGKTWVDAGLRKAGKVGEYSIEPPTWRRLGSSFNRVFRVTMTDPIQWRILGADLELKGGTGR